MAYTVMSRTYTILQTYPGDYTSAGEGSVYRARQRGSQRKASYALLFVVTGPRDTQRRWTFADGHSQTTTFYVFGSCFRTLAVILFQICET